MLYSNTFSIFLTRFFPNLANVLVWIFFSRTLTPDVNGAYQNFWIHTYMIYPLACLGLHQLLLTYKPETLTHFFNLLKPRHFTSYLAWLAGMGIVFHYIQFSEHPVNITLSFFLMVIFPLSVILESFLIVAGQFKALIAANILYSVAYLGVHYYFFSSPLNLSLIFGGIAVIGTIRLFAYLFAAQKALTTYKIESKSRVEDIAISKVKTLWVHMSVYDTIQTYSTYVDKFIVSLLLPSATSAIYFTGTQNIPFLSIILSAASGATMMQLKGEKDKPEHALFTIKASARAQGAVVFPILCFLLFSRHEIFWFLSGESNKYAASIPIFVASLMMLPFKAYSYTTILQKYHKGNIINAGAIIELSLSIALMYPFYKIWGLPGLALSFVAATIVQVAIYLHFTSKLLKVNIFMLLPFANWIVKVIIFGALFFVTDHVLRPLCGPLILFSVQTVLLIVSIAVSLFTEFKLLNRHGIAHAKQN